MIKYLIIFVGIFVIYLFSRKIFLIEKFSSGFINNAQLIVSQSNSSQKNLTRNKYINAPLIIDIKGNENFYPETGLSVKTNKVLLTSAAISIAIGILFLEVDSILNQIRLTASKINIGEYLFRWINKIL
jgi:hypothetical protein